MSKSAKKISLGFGLLAVAVGAALVAGLFTLSGPALAADNRTLTVAWENTTTDPAINHHGGSFLHATAGSPNAVDKKMQLQLLDSSNVVLQNFILEGDPVSTGGGGTAELFDELYGYSSGSTFVVRATFFNAAGIQIDQMNANFTKP